VVMLTIGAFNVFPSVKLITEGGPAFQTEVVLTWMYYKAFGTGDFGYAAALSYIVAMIVTGFTVLQFGLFRRERKGGARA
jgi:multiple sugar transport system permease protein